MALTRFIRGTGDVAIRSWTVLAGVALALALLTIPAQAESPCDSLTVIPDALENLRSDCEALWNFYTNLDDRGVLDDAGNPKAWLPTTPFVEWQGVGIGTSGVVVLTLSDLKLRGSISAELGRLTNLSALVLDSNELTGPIPPELGSLTNLEILTVHNNQMSGPVPPELGSLTNLSVLVLYGNELTGSIPPQLGNLSKLTFLELGDNAFTGSIPRELGRLSELIYLVIYNNHLTGPIPSQLGDLTNLRHLYLFNNRLTGSIPSGLGRLENLESLDLGGNQLTGSLPPELGKLTNLKFLSLRGNNLTGAIPPELGSLVKLEKLYLGGNELTGPIPQALSHLVQADGGDNNRETGGDARIDPFAADPLGLIAHVDFYRAHSLGTTVWHLWFCDIPLGDTPIDHDAVEKRLNREVTPYFEWVSGGRYRPAFRVAGTVTGDSRPDCAAAVIEQNPERPVLLVEDTEANDGYASRDMVVVGAGTVAKVPRFPEPRLTTVAHEIGHALGFPHSFGGKITWSPDGQFSGVYEYDNPMDVMSGGLALGLETGTIAVNRYAAGWIQPDEVVVHEAGTTAVYELRPAGEGGLQMLVLPGTRPGRFTALGVRGAGRYEAAIPRSGVEVYRIDQRESSCSRPSYGACWGPNRRTQPYPPAEPGAGYGDDLFGRSLARLAKHVHPAGDMFKIGTATVEVVERVGAHFRVRVVDSSTPTPPPEPSPEPSFAGRFSDDDGNVHEANIEVMAELGITLGCNPPDNDRYCPAKVVARAQMIAFLARALGEEGNPELTTSRFSDVPDNAWYLGYLERLADLGVAEPYEDGTFRPYEPLTRRDMAVFLARAFPFISEVADPVGVFVDVPADAEYAGAVEGILTAGVTKGCSAEPLSYCPDKAVPRDQMASFLARALKGLFANGGE